MTNNEILDHWHKAERAHKLASGPDYGRTLYTKMAAEQAAIERFGLGPHRKAYAVRFAGEEPSRE